MILVDTSVWIDFLAGRPAAADLKALLLAGEVVCHPAVRGEVALGSLAERERVLALLGTLPRAGAVDDERVIELISRSHLAGTGIGWVDAHLLACAQSNRLRLWTHDRRLEKAARRLGVVRSYAAP
jgi:predicted nucleic acid-binding protein